MKLTILFSLLIFTLSCNRNKTVKFDITERPKAEVIDVGHIHKIYFLYCTEDFLIISGKDINKNELHVYSLPDLKYLYSTGQVGNADNEIKGHAQFFGSDSPIRNFVYILGYSYTHLKGVTIRRDGVLDFVSEVNLKTLGQLNRTFLYDNRYLIYYDNPEWIKKYDIQTKNVIEKIHLGENVNNQVDGNIVANKDYVIYVAKNQRKINLYSAEKFKLIATINGVLNPNSKSQYHDSFAGKEQFYAFSAEDEFKDGQRITSKLEVYDYKGNPIKQYVFEVPFSRCVVDEYNGYIYGYIFGENDKFVRYKM